jgi:chemotaxis response regulator CheB
MKKKNIKSGANEPLSKSTNQFLVVGISESIGGLDAFKKLLEAISDNSATDSKTD